MARRRVLHGRYELDELPIGRGGMGEVWTGRDVRLGREVAVKLIRFPDGVHDEELVRRFVRESRITAGLEHPGVPAVFDVGTDDDGRPFMVMQRVRGISVADLVAEQGPLPVGWAASIAAQTCAVLVAAHGAGLVHRDLKPGNLMLCPDGTVKVLDFGLAVALASGDSQITRTGQSLGTPAYMAPELVLAGETGPHTDLYAVGCTLYEMLTGRAPFRGSTAYAVMNKQVDEPPAPVRRHRADAPAALGTLVADLLAKRPEDRPTDAATVYRRLAPEAADLTALPGVLAPEAATGPVRLYAAVVGRPLGSVSVSGEPGPAGGSVPRFTRSELDRARAEAASLARRSRYREAAGVLEAAVGPASLLLGPVSPELLSLRMELATHRFDGGDYAGAAPLFRALAADVAAAPGDGAEVARRCRLQEAACHALLGDTTTALGQLTVLLDEEREQHGADDDRVLELRKQIALLGMADDAVGARAQLRALLADVERVDGRDSPRSDEIRSLLRDDPRWHGDSIG